MCVCVCVQDRFTHLAVAAAKYCLEDAGLDMSKARRASESPIRVAYPSRLSESRIRVTYPSRISESHIRVTYPSRCLEDAGRDMGTARAC